MSAAATAAPSYTFRPLKDARYTICNECHIFDGIPSPAHWRPGAIGIQWSGRSLGFLQSLLVSLPADTAVGASLWHAAPQSDETLARVFPKDDGKHALVDYTLLFAFQTGTASGTVVLKAAAQHRASGDVVLLTSQNTPMTERHYAATADDWYVWRADMIAPPLFWRSFAAC